MSRFPMLRRFYHLIPGKELRAAAYRSFLRCSGPRYRHAIIEGVHFRLDMSEVIDSSLFMGSWEPDVSMAIDTHCRPGMTVLDIGANIGAHTFRIARAVGEQGTVHAFEPTIFAFSKLTSNLSLNQFPQVHLHRLALSNIDRDCQDISWRSSWQVQGGVHSDWAPCTVDFKRLDGWIANAHINRVDAIKIDTDGNEYPVFAGSSALIERCRPIMFMEAVGPHFSDPASNPFLFLERYGYRFDVPTQGLSGLDALSLQQMLPTNDPGMTTSLNLIAKAQI